MVSKSHCPVCGFLMMYSMKEEVNYICVNTHDAAIEDPGLGPNLDILLEYLKRP